MWALGPDEPWPTKSWKEPISQIWKQVDFSVGELVRKGVTEFQRTTLLHPTVVFFGRTAWEKVKEENVRAMRADVKGEAITEYMGMSVEWLAHEGIMLAYSPQFDPTKG